jgi:hypothetical protein
MLAYLAAALRTIGICVLAGVIAAAVVGGLGGRAAMRVSGYLFERAHPNVIAITQSSGERVGQITLAGTLNLIVEVALFYGLPGGFLYLLVAPWLPRAGRARGLAFACVLLAIAGAAVIASENRDFQRFGSPLLNIVMFVALIVGYGLAVVILVGWFERALRSDSASRGRRASVAVIRLATLAGGVLGVLAAMLVAVSLTVAAGRVRRLALGAVGLAVLVTLVQLIISIYAILTGV